MTNRRSSQRRSDSPICRSTKDRYERPVIDPLTVVLEQRAQSHST
jgi:hypothetical protein